MVIEDDSVLEDTETFLLSLDIGPGATYDGNSFANITITDDDEVMVQFSSEVCALSVSEDAGSLEVSVARIGLSSIPVTVSVQIQSGTAIGTYNFVVHLLCSTIMYYRYIRISVRSFNLKHTYVCIIAKI